MSALKQTSRMQHIRTFLTLLLTLVCLFLVIRSISIPEAVAILRQTDIGFLLLAWGMNFIMVALTAYRWYRLYDVYDHQTPSYWELLKATFIGAFFNNFLPSSLGSDVYRTFHASRTDPERGLSGALSVVVVDRLLGLLGLTLVGLGALSLQGSIVVGITTQLRAVVIAFSIVLAVVFFMSLQPSSYRYAHTVLAFLDFPEHSWLRKQLNNLELHLLLHSQRRDLIFVGLCLSVVMRCVWLLGCYYVGRSLQVNLSPSPYFVFIPIIEIIRMIPFTIQGIGVREGLFVLFFGTVGLTASEATLISFTIYLMLNLNGLIGGILYLFDRRKSPSVVGI